MKPPLTLDELAALIRAWLIEERKRMVEPPAQDSTMTILRTRETVTRQAHNLERSGATPGSATEDDE